MRTVDLAASIYGTGRQARRLKFMLTPSAAKNKFDADDRVTFCPMEAIGENGELDTGIMKRYEEVSSGYTRFTNGDVVVAKITPCFENGKGAIIRGLEPETGFGTTELHVLTPGKQLHGPFLYYVTRSSSFRGLGEEQMTGAAGQKRVPTEFVRDYPIWTPSLADQKRIAAFLDRETEAIDRLIAEKDAMLVLLEEQRTTLITDAVTRGLDPNVSLKPSGLKWLDRVPVHWNVLPLKRTWLSAEYGTSESIRDEGDVRVLRMSCITKDGLIDMTQAGQMEDVDQSLLLHRGDLLFNRTNSLDQIAKVGWLPDEPETPTSFASYLVRIRINKRANQEYLVTLLNSRDFLLFARSNAIPAIGQANLSPSRYGDIHIPLPPPEEQAAIIEYLSAHLARSKTLEDNLQASIDLLKERRKALITAAVTGQIPFEEMST